MSASRIVLDVNVMVSRALRPQSIPGIAARAAWVDGEVLISENLIAEMVSVLRRPKFAAYLDRNDLAAFVEEVVANSTLIDVSVSVQICRDPDDDHILALALSGQADMIVTGDRDLLILNPFQGIQVLTPRDFWETATSR